MSIAPLIALTVSISLGGSSSASSVKRAITCTFTNANSVDIDVNVCATDRTDGLPAVVDTPTGTVIKGLVSELDIKPGESQSCTLQGHGGYMFSAYPHSLGFGSTIPFIHRNLSSSGVVRVDLGIRTLRRTFQNKTQTVVEIKDVKTGTNAFIPPFELGPDESKTLDYIVYKGKVVFTAYGYPPKQFQLTGTFGDDGTTTIRDDGVSGEDDADIASNKLDEIRMASHSDLPQAKSTNDSSDGNESFILKNETSFDLRAWWKGSGSGSVVVRKGESRDLGWKPGKYDIAVEATGPAGRNVLPLYGSLTFQPSSREILTITSGGGN